ncbi:hypothetical protein ACCS61_32440 [Rhizobium ruizarguesonis]
MWSLLQRKTQVTIIVFASVVSTLGLQALWLWLMGEQTNWWKWLSLVVFIVGVLLVAAADLLWFPVARRFPILQRKLFPDLNGEWKGYLYSTWINPQTGQTPPAIPTTVTIRQSFFSTSIALQTGESRSQSTRAFLEPDYVNRRYRLWYSYNNEPLAIYRHRSSPHEGVAYLDLDWDQNRNELLGTYYTARKSTGDMKLERKPAC